MLIDVYSDVVCPWCYIGVFRHRGLGSYADREDLTRTVAPMGVGSVLGALVGGLSLPTALAWNRGTLTGRQGPIHMPGGHFFGGRISRNSVKRKFAASPFYEVG